MHLSGDYSRLMLSAILLCEARTFLTRKASAVVRPADKVIIAQSPLFFNRVVCTFCGDIFKMYMKVENGVIVDVKFKTFGCGAAIATSSMATEMVKGKTLEEALQLTNKAVADALDGLPPVKMHCSLLAEEAIHAAVEDYMKNHPGE